MQAAKDKTTRCWRPTPPTCRRAGRDELLARARPGDYVALLAFIDPAREGELAPLVQRAHESGCVVTTGLGPRFLHSTGQLHKGGPKTASSCRSWTSRVANCRFPVATSASAG